LTKKSNKLKIIPLGGLNEVGKNMTVFEYGNDIILIDCGLKFPEDDMLGIDSVIPDMTYLTKNKDKIRAVVLTHGHEDHIGALPYFLKEHNVPIYGTRLTLGLVERKLSEHMDVSKAKLKKIRPRMKVKLGSFEVEFIRVSHSIPDAVGLCINTPMGRVIHTGDFKVDFTPIDGQMIDLQKFAQLGNEGVLCLMADSTNVERPGYTMSESRVGDTFETIFRHADQRIIVASFASNVHRIQQIVNAARSNNRKVAFSGRSMVNVTAVAKDLGYINVPDDMIIEINDINGYPDNEICIITTGSQGEPMAALSRMARGEHRQIQIQKDDLVIFSSTPIPGNEKSVKNVVNRLFEQGANVIYERLAEVHVSGHACQEELKLIHSLVKPKYFIPVHGEFSHLRQHAILAESLGMTKDNIFIAKIGDTIEFSESGAKFGKTVPSGATLIDGLGIGDVGNIVLRDRRVLSEDGLLVIIVGISRETGKVVSGPDIISRGFVYVRESEALMSNIREVARMTMVSCEKNNIREWSALKSALRQDLNDYLYKNIKRNPMLLPVIMEV